MRVRIAAMSLLVVMVASACGSSTAVTTAVTTPTTGGTADPLAAYFIAPALCNNVTAADCTKLRLGDSNLSTTTPARGSLFSCAAGNANAPGSNASKITWIDNAAGTWNLLKKPWLPSGTFSAGQGTYSAAVQSGTRTIQVNDVPVDLKIGNWPMTSYALLTAIDGNPGVPAAKIFTFDLPAV